MEIIADVGEQTHRIAEAAEPESDIGWGTTRSVSVLSLRSRHDVDECLTDDKNAHPESLWGAESLACMNRKNIGGEVPMARFHVSAVWDCSTMDKNMMDNDVRSIIDAAAERILVPRPGECLACYVFRQLGEFGCNGTHRFALTFRDHTAPRATALLSRLRSLGACCCDGEIILNAYGLSANPWIIESGSFAEALGAPIRLIDGGRRTDDGRGIDDERWPDEIDDTRTTTRYLCCKIVRRGSTQPCGNWARRHRR